MVIVEIVADRTTKAKFDPTLNIGPRFRTRPAIAG